MKTALRVMPILLAMMPCAALSQSPEQPCAPGEDVCLVLIDQDNDGSLNQAEIAHYMAESADASQDAAQVLQDYDVNGDAQIDENEFGLGIADDLDPISSTPSYNL